ncbi:MAG: hypothetical protein KY462_03645 [Actinobacteria bacterium]|nr:hypothetical protein [Actinomycetota bacterium]
MVSAAAAVVAALFAVALVRRYVTRGRTNPALLTWALSLAMFAVAATALAYGEAAGWSSGWFRVYYLFGGVLVVPWLAVGTVQIAARDRVNLRVLGVTAVIVAVVMVVPLVVAAEPTLFATGVVVSALWGLLLLTAGRDAAPAGSIAIVATFTAVAGFAVLAAALAGPVPTTGLPEGSDLFPAGVRSFAVAGNALGAVLVVVGSVTSALRLRGQGTPHLVVGNLLIALGVLVSASGGAFAFLGDTESHAVAFAVGVSVMYAGFARTTRPLPAAAPPPRPVTGSRSGEAQLP